MGHLCRGSDQVDLRVALKQRNFVVQSANIQPRQQRNDTHSSINISNGARYHSVTTQDERCRTDIRFIRPLEATNQKDVDQPYRGIPQHTLREIRTFQFKSHPGLLDLIEVIQTEDGPCGFPLLHLVTEFIDQDLKVFIEKMPHLLVETKIKSIMGQLVQAVSHLNWVLRIMHRDLKPANILISHTGVVKIADFGMAKVYKYKKILTPRVVTLWYRAPEILMNCEYHFAVDVWSLGCIFAELYNKIPLFEGNSEITQLNLIIVRIGLPPQHKWPMSSPIPYDHFRNNTYIPIRQFLPTAPLTAVQTIEAMLEFDPEARVVSDKLQDLPYFL